MGLNRKWVLDSLSEAVGRTILRGPRPPATAWPRASNRSVAKSPAHKFPSPAPKKGKGKGQPRSPQSVQGQSVCAPPHLRHATKPPEKAAADAVEEIERLKAAISALGESSMLSKPLREALRAAQVRASVPPIQERVDSCKLFLERARKRVHRAQEVIDRAHEQKVVYETEVAEGEARLAKLMAEAAFVQTPPVVLPQVSAPTIIPNDAQGTWMCGGPPRFEDIPSMPTSNVQDLGGWMSQRNCELRNAIEFGDPVLVAKIGGLVGQGTALLSSIGRNLPDITRQPDFSDDEIRSRSAPGRKVRTILKSHAKDKLYGLRGGVRVGKASHQGPEQEVFRVPEDVLDDLEAALTRIDSSGFDDERLVRPPSDKNVMPRRFVTERSQEVKRTRSVRSWQSAQVMWSSEADDEDVRDQSNYEGHCRRRQSGLNTQVDGSDSQAPMVRSGRFAALSHVSEDEEHEDAPRARDIATLPMRMGGLGLRCAVRCAHAAFWASWQMLCTLSE